MLPIDALIEPLTEEQVESTVYDLLAAVGVKARSWKAGGTARTIIGVTSKVISGFTNVMSAGIKGTILELAEGVWLTVLAKYVYGVERIGATVASGTITLINAGGGVYDLAPGELVVLATGPKKAYRNTAAISLGPLETLQDVPIEALEVGSASSAAPGEIDAFVTPLLDVTVTNVSPVIGQDEQSDPSLRQDCADARGALSPFGAPGAYAYFAKRVPGGKALLRTDGSAVGVSRVQVVRTNLSGLVTVYVASPSGELSTEDLELVDNNIKLYAVPAGITEHTFNGNPTDVVVLYTAYADAAAGETATQIKAKIDASLIEYFASFPIGGLTINGTDFYLFLTQVQKRIAAADEAIMKVILSGPIADVPLAEGEFAHLIIANGSAVNLVAQ